MFGAVREATGLSFAGERGFSAATHRLKKQAFRVACRDGGNCANGFRMSSSDTTLTRNLAHGHLSAHSKESPPGLWRICV